MNHSPKDLYQSWLEAHPPRLTFAQRGSLSPSQWQVELRSKLMECLGQMPDRVAPEARQLEESDAGDHVRQKWVLRTEVDFWLPFYLLLPKERSEPAPAVIALHGHGPGKRWPAGIASDAEERATVFGGERDYGVQAVQQGYITLCPDMRGFGECVDEDHREIQHNESCRYSAGRSLMLGRTLLGERVWDVSRAIDFLETLPAVDSGRIACIGHSGGGTVTLLAGAIEPRIAVTVVSAYLCAWQRSIYGVAHCPCNYVPNLARYADCGDISGLMAPRPQLFVTGDRDPIFPLDGVRAAFATVQSVYRSLGVEDKTDLYVGAGEHRFFKEPVWPFVEQWMAGHSE